MQQAGMPGAASLRSYRVKLIWRVFLAVLVAPIVALLVMVVLLPIIHGGARSLPVTLFSLVVSFVVLAFFALGALDAMRSVLHVYPDRIVKKDVFRTREYRLADIEGFRLLQGKYLFLFPKQKEEKKIKLPSMLERFDELTAWAARSLPDLDARDAAVERQEILNDRELGATEHERSALYEKFNVALRYLNGAGLGIGLWTFLYPRPYETLLVLCALFPLAGVAVLAQSKGLVRFDERKNSAHPAIIRMFMMPSFALALRSLFDFSIIDATLLLTPVAVTTAVLSVVILTRSKESSGRIGIKLMIVLFVAVYAYGLTVTGNCLFDRSRPEVFQVQVMQKYISKGRSTSYHVKLAAWGPIAKPDDTTVPRVIYDEVSVGREVAVYKKNGILGIPWFFIIPR